MGHRIEIYVFDNKKASQNLYRDLKGKEFEASFYKSQKFSDFLIEYNSKLKLDDILKIVKNDINFITKGIYEITEFLPINPKELKDYGIIELFSTGGTIEANGYHTQYYNYIDIFKFKTLKANGIINLDSKDFLEFNDYMILLMDKIHSSGIGERHELNEFDLFVINDVKEENRENLLLMKEIEMEVKNLTESDIPFEKYMLDLSGYFLLCSIEMKLKINIEKHPRVLILNSM